MMPVEEIGELNEILGEVMFEWRIKDFLRLHDRVDTCYESPEFLFSGASWNINLYPNGESRSEANSEGWITLFVHKLSPDIPIHVDYSFSLKTADGKTDKERGHSSLFEKLGWGFYKFMRRSELTERQSELLPSGALTVICSLRNSENSNDDGFCKLQQHLEELLSNESVSDVILKVDDEEFKAHRSILAARSPVFMAMMSHETKEKISGVVEIPDIDPNTFPDFLNYLYTGNMENVTSDNVTQLYIVADKYQVDDLKKVCVDYIVKNMAVDNFCDFLALSLQCPDESLTNACSQFFIENALDIIVAPNWQIFLRENPTAGNDLHIKHLKQLQGDVKRKRRC